MGTRIAIQTFHFVAKANSQGIAIVCYKRRFRNLNGRAAANRVSTICQ